MTKPLNEVEFMLAQHEWECTGGGDDFDAWSSSDWEDVTVYVYDDGRWEYHVYGVQGSDSPEDATERGQGAEALFALLASEDAGR